MASELSRNSAWRPQPFCPIHGASIFRLGVARLTSAHGPTRRCARRTSIVLPLHFYKTIVSCPVEVQGDNMDERLDLPQGTLDLLILKSLSLGPQHGWAVSERIHQISQATLAVPQGSLYPALHRLERRGWIKAKWGASDNNRRAKYYSLTPRGRAQLETEEDAWNRLVAAVGLVMKTT
ncbi:MAG TPA: PadR family transcriptional regulator [Gemmatimonadaceae bacterium]|nr:PadR family transcriptional regulator [Gemmatimonadaceae bacterium]